MILRPTVIAWTSRDVAPVVDDPDWGRPPERRCSGQGCTTILSRYNGSDLCSSCRNRRHRLASVPAEPAPAPSVDLEVLMQEPGR